MILSGLKTNGRLSARVKATFLLASAQERDHDVAHFHYVENSQCLLSANA